MAQMQIQHKYSTVLSLLDECGQPSNGLIVGEAYSACPKELVGSPTTYHGDSNSFDCIVAGHIKYALIDGKIVGVSLFNPEYEPSKINTRTNG